MLQAKIGLMVLLAAAGLALTGCAQPAQQSAGNLPIAEGDGIKPATGVGVVVPAATATPEYTVGGQPVPGTGGGVAFPADVPQVKRTVGGQIVPNTGGTGVKVIP